jgi:carbonic anhydrase
MYGITEHQLLHEYKWLDLPRILKHLRRHKASDQLKTLNLLFMRNGGDEAMQKINELVQTANGTDEILKQVDPEEVSYLEKQGFMIQ